MKQRGRFLYQNAQEVIFITFERGTKGVPIESILPECGRGAGFKDFRISDYFDLADLVLAAPKEWSEFSRNLDLTGVTKDSPKKVSPPAPNLDFLKLRNKEGMDAERSVNLFEIVAAYWSAPKNTLALEPGLVATLWRRGMPAADIIRSIQASTDKDGKMIKASGRGHDIMHTVIEAYLEVKNLPPNAELSQDEMGELVERWLTATRSAPLKSADAANSVLHWSDYRCLGVVDQAGSVQVDQVRLIATKIFSINGQLSFKALSAWVDIYHPPQTASPSQRSTAARVMLKKKRKQGKLNRKRGRR